MIVSPKNRRSVEEVFRDYCGRHSAIVKALTTDIERFYLICDPEQDNLCLFGHANGDWELGFPAEDVPTELPEPVVGINFARDGMKEKDWLLLVAAHSDAWLLSVAFYFGGRFGFGSVKRKRLFAMINELPTVSEMVTGTLKAKAKSSGSTSNNTKKDKSGSKGGGSASGKKSKKGKEEEEEDLDENADAVAIADADVDEGFDGKYKEADGETETLCGVCGEAYETNQFWICCDKCDKWFHGKCVNVTEARADHIKQYKCPSCSKRGRHNNSS